MRAKSNQLAIFESMEQKSADFAVLQHDGAMEVARKIRKGGRVLGLTRGQFSLIDLIYAVLKEFGPGDVVCTTWSAGIKDAHNVKWMVDTALINSFCLVTDHSYKTRQPKYALTLSELFGDENIRTSEIHAKFTLLRCGDMFITIRTSMNLNANRTCESFEIDEDRAIYEFYHQFVTSTFGQMPLGFTADSAVVNRALTRTFNEIKDEFFWQTND